MFSRKSLDFVKCWSNEDLMIFNRNNYVDVGYEVKNLVKLDIGLQNLQWFFLYLFYWKLRSMGGDLDEVGVLVEGFLMLLNVGEGFLNEDIIINDQKQEKSIMEMQEKEKLFCLLQILVLVIGLIFYVLFILFKC